MSVTAAGGVTSIKAGETLQLTATVLPEKTADKSVTWTSSNESVATIDNAGLVSSVGTITAASEVTFTATTKNEVSGSIKITVELPDVTNVTVTTADGATSVKAGKTLQLSAAILPENAVKTVTWSSSNEAFATIDANGLVTAVSSISESADVTFTATAASGVSDSITIKVELPDVEKVEVSAADGATSVKVGATLQLSAAVSPTNAADQTVTWSSNNEEVATIDSNGLVTPVSSITASSEVTFTATSTTGVYGTITITVELPDAAAVKITSKGSATSVMSEDTLQLYATVTPSNAADKTVTWSSSDEKVATVDSTGLVTGAAGVSEDTKVTITATTANGVSGTFELTVTPKLAIYNTKETSLEASEFAAAMSGYGNSSSTYYSFGYTYIHGVVTSSSYNSTYKSYTLYLDAGDYTVQIYSAQLGEGITGDFTAADALVDYTVYTYGYAVDYVRSGAHTYEVAYSSTTGFTPVIYDAKVVQTSVTVTAAGGATSVYSGNTLELSASIAPSVADQTVTWESDKPTVATVDENGLVTALDVASATEVTFTATSSDGLKGQITITVEPKPVAAIGSVTLSSVAESLHTCGGSVTLTATTAPEDSSFTEWDTSVNWSVEGDAKEYVSVEAGVVTVLNGATAGTTATVTATANTAKADGTLASASCTITIVDPKVAEITKVGYSVSFTGVLVHSATTGNMYIDDGTAGIRVNPGKSYTVGNYYTVTGTTALHNNSQSIYIDEAVLTANEGTPTSTTSITPLTDEAAATYLAQDTYTPLGQFSLTTSEVSKNSYGYFTWTANGISMETAGTSAAMTTAFLEEGYAYNLTGYIYGRYGNYLMFYITSANLVEGSVTVSGENSVAIGDSVELTATTADGAGGTTEGTYTWSSSNTEVATVENGVVSGVGAGSAIITATNGDYSDSLEITVTDPNASNLTIDADNLGLAGKYADYTSTISEVSFTAAQCYKGSRGIQMRYKSVESAIYNTTAFSSGIANIVINFNSSFTNTATLLYAVFGDSEQSAVTSGTSIAKSSDSSSVTITPDALTYTYFKIGHKTSPTTTVYIDSIVVNFAE